MKICNAVSAQWEKNEIFFSMNSSIEDIDFLRGVLLIIASHLPFTYGDASDHTKKSYKYINKKLKKIYCAVCINHLYYDSFPFLKFYIFFVLFAGK